jgi:hypothetical protein
MAQWKAQTAVTNIIALFLFRVSILPFELSPESPNEDGNNREAYR